MTNTLKKASTLKEVYKLFDPMRELAEEELDAFYVDRNSEKRQEIILLLQEDLELEKPKPVHLLFTGHRGSGKSTEINKLCRELDDKFFIVIVSFSNRPNIDYIDILLKTAMALFKRATDEEIIKKVPAQIVEDVWNSLYKFIDKNLFGDTHISKGLDTKKTFTAKINFLAGLFEGKFEAEPQSRQQFKDRCEELLLEIIYKIDLLSKNIRENYNKPVLFIFEDTDRINLKSAKEIFYEHSGTLVDITASSIYVIDISLRYHPNFNNTKTSFSDCFCLPNIKLVTKDGRFTEENKVLENIIDCRAENSLFATDTKEALIKASGGLIRTLINLIQTAALRARVKNMEQITMEHVEYAISKQKGEFIAMLRREDYPLLLERHQDKRLTSNDDTQTLLQSLALLEYDNGELWCDVHPIILPEVMERTL